ncbi:MAG: hypothetical protein CVU03_02200 [Bacteroidetes bacterium HGW-Bacteroidetes-2]|jgi:Zn-dependent peptidase ImmA (M78 family)|nr:MAG: hypothetical protein CVU13_06110 [Bacteroidetes bacterium HGW-Bacteroidetes-8]PKP26707.1 MAG: hypothetical protein CVU03_02200 [Bacteroidetes bacterium HGW-Bacteroidetes-2]
MNNRHKDVDKLLNRLFSKDDRVNTFQIKELFEQRIEYLSITKNQACKILDWDNKTLDAFLEGDSKKIDFVSILKMSDFLDIPHDILIEKYFDLALDSYNESIELTKKRNFIVNYFDLPSLKKIGFIKSINDFEEIEDRINSFFGYDSIFEHQKHHIDGVFSSAKRKTNHRNLQFWYAAVKESIDRTPNPYEYDREGLIDYFPKIRWHCMDVENGLTVVAQKLFKLGITLIVVPKYNQDVHIRAVTFSHGGKPCIALTKYTQFYPTIWFALVHELFHVLYDWEIILREKQHFSIDSSKDNQSGLAIHTIGIDEDEADNFARQYLFPDEKMKAILPHIHNSDYIEEFARLNHVHPSLIYVFYLWDYGDSKAYGRFNRFFPKEDFSRLLNNFSFDLYDNFKPLKVVCQTRNKNLNYNTL